MSAAESGGQAEPTLAQVIARAGLSLKPHPRGYPMWRDCYRDGVKLGSWSPQELWRRWHANEFPFSKQEPRS